MTWVRSCLAGMKCRCNSHLTQLAPAVPGIVATPRRPSPISSFVTGQSIPCVDAMSRIGTKSNMPRQEPRRHTGLAPADL
jgi:hypothetical protein